MSKDDMINLLLRDIESDRYHMAGWARADRARSDQAMKLESSRLEALSFGEIEALYFDAEDAYALSA